MATYVVLARFTAQGVKNAKDSPKRAEAFKQMAETFGVTVKDIFWTQGRYDIVILIDAPDEVSATALNLSLSALGNIRTESLRVLFFNRHVEDRRQNALTQHNQCVGLPRSCPLWVKSRHDGSMSALPPKADIVRHGGNVRFVPKADIRGYSITSSERA